MTEQSTEFAGLAALVTGGASGIGLATARLLAARGARVAVLDRDQPSGDTGEGLYPVLADVTDDTAVRAAVARAGQALAGLDILVNNAGIGAAGTVEDNDDQPMGRLVTAEEVAAAIAYLASPLAGATTGTALAVDGGMSGLRVRPRPA